MVMYSMTKLLWFFSRIMEFIQYNSCLATTEAILGTSKEKIYQELGLEPLQLRRSYRKLCLFYKVFKNEYPKYLFNLTPVKSTSYATRTMNNIPVIKTKHNFFKSYFFSSAIIDWNNLDPILRNSKRISVFKEKYLISYDLPQIIFLIIASLKELNLLQDLDSV